jgi:aryl-alcohol dehydrogenase-like predicted oxidoreductase
MRSEAIADGVRFSQIGLGGWELRGGDTTRAEPSAAAAESIVEAALSMGLNWIDTAEIYFEGRNEALIGLVLEKVHGEMLVSTKFGPSPIGSGFRPSEIEAACLRSLARLRRKVLDICFLHWPDEQGIPLADTWQAMSELADRGLVRALGLSNFRLLDICECHAHRRVDVVQLGLSLIDHRQNVELISVCHDLGIPVVVYEPLANGILTDKELSELRVTWGFGSEEWDCYERLLAPGVINRTGAIVKRLRQLASENGVSIAQLALGWVLSVPGVSAVIVGTTKETHVAESASAAKLNLDVELLMTLDEIGGFRRLPGGQGKSAPSLPLGPDALRT